MAKTSTGRAAPAKVKSAARGATARQKTKAATETPKQKAAVKKTKFITKL